MHKLCEYIDDELMELERKADKQGKLSGAEVEYGEKLAKFKQALLTNKAMEEDGEYSNEYGGNSYARNGGRSSNRSGGNSYARGRTGNVRRDSMGRYSREGGYSYDEAMDEMATAIREGMGDMPEHLKHDAERFLKKIENEM